MNMPHLSTAAAERVLSHTPVEEETTRTQLPVTFVPSNYDVICGCPVTSDHIGNRRFRVTIDMNLARYAGTSSKTEKGAIIKSIVDTIRDASSNGGFVKLDPDSGRWYEVGDRSARDQVRDAFGEALRARLYPEKRRVTWTGTDPVQSSNSDSKRKSQSRASIGKVSVSCTGGKSVSRRVSFSMDPPSFRQILNGASAD